MSHSCSTSYTTPLDHCDSLDRLERKNKLTNIPPEKRGHSGVGPTCCVTHGVYSGKRLNTVSTRTVERVQPLLLLCTFVKLQLLSTINYRHSVINSFNRVSFYRLLWSINLVSIFGCSSPSLNPVYTDKLNRTCTSGRASDPWAGVFDGCLRLRLWFGVNSQMQQVLSPVGEIYS